MTVVTDKGFRDADTALVGDRRVSSRARPARDKQPDSPYFRVPNADRLERTRDLIRAFPMPPAELVRAVVLSWESIFESTLGRRFLIGRDVFPTPQIMGTLLHELIPLELAAEHPKLWRLQMTSAEKDLVCVQDDRYSVEIKTSSDKGRIYANRSYGQEASDTVWKKSKSGYYLAVNFEKWPSSVERPAPVQIRPAIHRVRFGWIDHSDWMSQAAATGQQSSLPAEIENTQLLSFFERE